MRKTSEIIKLVSLAWLAVVTLSACGGGAGTESNQDDGDSTTAGLISNSTAPEVVAYKEEVWDKLSSQSRCGRCHGTGGQEPQFVHGDSIETAHAAALTFVRGTQVANLASPNDSLMVTTIRNGHKQVNGKSQACWLATDAACADEIRNFIANWNGDTSGTAAKPKGVQLVAPPIRGAEDSKNFPVDSTDFDFWVHNPILEVHCADCHTPTASNPQAPFFASNDVNASYLAAQQKIDLLNPANSRFVLRLRDQFHNCWTNDCDADADAMELAITNYANTITATTIDPNLIVSKALKLQPPEAIIASGGERHVTSQIALWEFKNEGGNPSSAIALDSSGVYPLMPLSLSGSYEWVGGYGVKFIDGKAQATGEASKKLLNNLRSRDEYSIEAWVIPANVAQQNKNIISYSGGPTARNFTIAQNEYHYQFYNRMTFPPVVGADQMVIRF